jgi:hypothetical protein
MTKKPWEDPAFDPTRNALIRRMVDLGYDNATSERADSMMRAWDWFTDNGIDDRGHPTYVDWMDPKIIELLFDALYLHYGVERPGPEQQA